MLALLHQNQDPQAPTATTDHVSSSTGSPFGTAPTTPTAQVATMRQQSSDAPSPSHRGSDRPFQCHEAGCGRRFNRKFTLSEHLKTHTGEKPYVCPVATCSKRFSTSGNLARHKRLHASIKPFECSFDYCKRSFPNELKLQQHLKIHLGGKTHICKAPGCSKSFSTAGNLTRHTKNHHSGQNALTVPIRSHAGGHDTSMFHHLASLSILHQPDDMQPIHSPVSVAKSISCGDHQQPHTLYSRSQMRLTTASSSSHTNRSANTPLGSMYEQAQSSSSQQQLSMANLYYSFNQSQGGGANGCDSNHGQVQQYPYPHHQHQHHHEHQHHQHTRLPGTFLPNNAFQQLALYDEMHHIQPLPLHANDGVSQNLFDDVIEFQLGDPRNRMMMMM